MRMARGSGRALPKQQAWKLRSTIHIRSDLRSCWAHYKFRELFECNLMLSAREPSAAKSVMCCYQVSLQHWRDPQRRDTAIAESSPRSNPSNFGRYRVAAKACLAASVNKTD